MSGTQSTLKPKWLSAIALFVMFYLMYSSTFLTDYLMRDEWEFVGGGDWYDLPSYMSTFFFRSGRVLFAMFQKLVLVFAGYDASRIQVVRFINFLSIAVIAVLLLIFLEKRVKNAWIAFFAILFFFSQTAFQALMGYSFELIAGSLPSMWLSLLAFYLFFFAFQNSRLPQIVQSGIIFLVLMLAMQSTQTYAFFAMVPLSYLTLTDWKSNKARIIQFLLISTVTLAVSTLIYKLGLDYFAAQGRAGYDVGERGINQLSTRPLDMILLAINPRTYWSVFKMWTFPFPFQNTPPLSNLIEKIASFAIMATWLGLVFTSVWFEFTNTAKDVRCEILFKWLAVVLCVGFGAAFILADSPNEIIDHRPHLHLIFSGIVIFTSVYALEILESRFAFLRSPAFIGVAGFLVVMTAFGAQSGVLRNIVNIHMKQLDFIRTELFRQDPASYGTVIVLLPIQNQDCITEPCGPWIGEHIENKGHLAREAAYRYTLSTLGMDPMEKKIIFVEKASEIVSMENALLIDWNIYSATQQIYAEHFLP